jgi:hypothetical protein
VIGVCICEFRLHRLLIHNIMEHLRHYKFTVLYASFAFVISLWKTWKGCLWLPPCQLYGVTMHQILCASWLTLLVAALILSSFIFCSTGGG